MQEKFCLGKPVGTKKWWPCWLLNQQLNLMGIVYVHRPSYVKDFQVSERDIAVAMEECANGESCDSCTEEVSVADFPSVNIRKALFGWKIFGTFVSNVHTLLLVFTVQLYLENCLTMTWPVLLSRIVWILSAINVGRIFFALIRTFFMLCNHEDAPHSHPHPSSLSPSLHAVLSFKGIK